MYAYLQQMVPHLATLLLRTTRILEFHSHARYWPTFLRVRPESMRFSLDLAHHIPEQHNPMGQARQLHELDLVHRM